MIENYQTYVTIVSYLSSIVSELLTTSFCFYRLAASFMEDKKKAFYSVMTYFFSISLLFLLPFSMPGYLVINAHFFSVLISVLAALLVMCRLERQNYEHKIFLSVTFLTLNWLTYAMTEVLYDNMYDLALRTKYMQAHTNMEFALYVGVVVFQCLLRFALLYIAIRCIIRAYSGQNLTMGKKELLMLIMPPLAGIAGYIVLHEYRVFYIIGSGEYFRICDALIFLYCAVSFITIVVVIVLYRSIWVKKEEEKQSEMLNAQIVSIRQHIKQVENLYQDIRGIRHDMANHLYTLEKLYEADETEEAKAYSGRLKETLTKMTGEIKSGNPVTDIILQEVKEETAKRGIAFQSAFFYPADSGIDAFDISVILHNGLQNALENIEGFETAHIFIRSYQKKNAYIIEINNSYGGALEWNARTGLPVTDKEKTDVSGYGKSHGYGLSNIRKIAGKYYGDIDIALAGGEFRLSVMLML